MAELFFNVVLVSSVLKNKTDLIQKLNGVKSREHFQTKVWIYISYTNWTKHTLRSLISLENGYELIKEIYLII